MRSEKEGAREQDILPKVELLDRFRLVECERFKPMTLKVVLEPGEDGWIVAECPALPGCVSQGRSETEAIDNIREAMELWLETELEKRAGSLPKNAKILEVTV